MKNLNKSTWTALLTSCLIFSGFLVGTSQAGASPSGSLQPGLTVTPGTPFGPAPGASGVQPDYQGLVFCSYAIVGSWESNVCIQYVSSSEIDTEGWLTQGPTYTGHQELTTNPSSSLDTNYGSGASYVAGGPAHEYAITGPSGTFPNTQNYCVHLWKSNGAGGYTSMDYLCTEDNLQIG